MMSNNAHAPIFFDKKISYDSILESLKVEFYRKWNVNTPSPSNNLHNYDVLAVLGEGSFGKVKFVKLRGTNIYSAAKQLLKIQIVQQKMVKNVFSEKQVLASVNFPFIISLEFSSKDNDALYMGLTYCSGGELFNYFRRMKKFSESTARFYAAQVFLAFEYLHFMYILYRDLKPENILITSTGYIKVGDLGMAKRVEGRTYSLCGSPEYFAPEIVKGRPYGVSADWWTFGVFIYELMAGRTPFVCGKTIELYERIVHCKYKMPHNFSPKAKDLLKNILNVDVTKRYGCMVNGNKDIKFHEWFNGVDWFALLNQEVKPPFVPRVTHMEDLSNFDKTADRRVAAKSNINTFADIFAEF